MTEAVEVKPHNISQEDSPEADDDGWNILEEVVRDDDKLNSKKFII